jgi:hypothetical protein
VQRVQQVGDGAPLGIRVLLGQVRGRRREDLERRVTVTDAGESDGAVRRRDDESSDTARSAISR